MIEGNLGRKFKTLRISLTSLCNLQCSYCVTGNKNDKYSDTSKQQLSANKLFQIVQQLHVILHLQSIRLTGGEPLIYKDIISFTQQLQQLSVPEIKLTTNGY